MKKITMTIILVIAMLLSITAQTQRFEVIGMCYRKNDAAFPRFTEWQEHNVYGIIAIDKSAIEIYENEIISLRLTTKVESTEEMTKFWAVDQNKVRCQVRLHNIDGVTHMYIDYKNITIGYLIDKDE